MDMDPFQIMPEVLHRWPNLANKSELVQMVWMLQVTPLQPLAKDSLLEVQLWFHYHYMEDSCIMLTYKKALKLA